MKWIKLKEQKPRDGEWCILWARSADSDQPFRTVSTFYKKKNSDGNHFPWIVPCWGKAFTHWMPFPKDPK